MPVDNRRSRFTSAVCVSALVLGALATSAQAGPAPVTASHIVLRSPAESVALSKRYWEGTDGAFGLFSSVLDTLGDITYTGCTTKYDVPASISCVAQCMESLIGMIAGVFSNATASRDEETYAGLVHLFPGNETHSPVDQMKSALPVDVYSLVGYNANADDSSFSKSAVYFKYEPDVGLDSFLVIPQADDFDPSVSPYSPPVKRSDFLKRGPSGIYLSITIASANGTTEHALAKKQSVMNNLAAQMLNNGKFTMRRVSCMNFFSVQYGNANKGVLAITEDATYAWPTSGTDWIQSC